MLSGDAKYERKYSERDSRQVGITTEVITHISTRIAPVLLCNSSKSALQRAKQKYEGILFGGQPLAVEVNVGAE